MEACGISLSSISGATGRVHRLHRLQDNLDSTDLTALRAGYQDYGSVEDISGNSTDHFHPNLESYELAVGYHLNHSQTLKVGYEWLKTAGQTGTRNNVFGIQFVTSVNSLSKAF